MAFYTALLAVCLFGAAIAAPKHNQWRQGKNLDTERFLAELVHDGDSVTSQETDQVVLSEDENIDSEQVANPVAPFPADVPPGIKWNRVGYLDMTDPTQQCFSAWKKYTSPRAACGKTTDGSGCNGVVFSTSGASYQKVCGRFRAYQVATPDGFDHGGSINDPYVDGISISYIQGTVRNHIFTYAASASESVSPHVCPCAGGSKPPSFVGTNYYCESGNPTSDFVYSNLYYSDPLWDGKQCGGLEGSCCNPSNLAWFCTTFPAPVTGDLEVRICTDQNLADEDVAIEYFELYTK